jgi:hypothetical protein
MSRGIIVVICNLGEEYRFPLPPGARILLASPAISHADQGSVMLPQDSVIILERSLHEQISKTQK